MTPAVQFTQTSAEMGGRTIPFDYSFQFSLPGPSGTIKQSLDVSVEGAFVAVSIGYGAIPAVQSIDFGPELSELTSPRLQDIPLSAILDAANRTFSRLPAMDQKRPAGDAVLMQGIRLNPSFARLALQQGQLSQRVLNQLFSIAGSVNTDIQFLYALTDEGTGRAFQSEPILNTAGLGISNGDRPFRYFVPPITFEPRSKISLEITLVSNFVGDLYVTLQGYKVLGRSDTPTGRLLSGHRHLHSRGRR